MLFFKKSIKCKKIGNVFNKDNMRVGIIKAKQNTYLKIFHSKILFCFSSCANYKQVFYGWCDNEEQIKNWISKEFPNSFITSNTEFDDILDGIEKITQSYNQGE